ncbi:hypothetical protein RDWZM_004342 [Blomia tropicalis]|uniref:Alpha-N-acetylglucosaminidase n=1 Tax=Blomia tropicalis TaxID=40697 RepID=A0A9Q0MJU1_BLOTA|nr:hypothetical protein RDWZM_004342 [Blomia tropicalis]
MNVANSSLDHLLTLKPKASIENQTETVKGLLERLLPKHAHLFEVVIDEHFVDHKHLDKFKIESTKNRTIRITGNTGIAVSNGLYYYLKNVANCSTSWSGDQLYRLPIDSLPKLNRPIEMIIRDKLRYYQNVCTVSYSMVWWNWNRWQQEIDWMALRGINLPLAFNGQESVFRRVFQTYFNLTQSQVDDYFSGPAFLAWNRMGNIQTWSGPLTEHWHQQQEQLQKKILERMRNYGMYPVLPGFGGHVPRALHTLMPKAKIDRLTDWNHFGKNYSYTYFLQPEDPNFIKINKLFIQEYIKLFGTDHFYNIDLFNEEQPTSNETTYLHKCGKGVYDSIMEADPNGIWVMQGWLFENQPYFWKMAQVKALVTSVPMGKLLVLDLFSEVAPIYFRFKGYFGQPFIWCMLHNFGGSNGMYGALNRINSLVYEARRTYSNMLGIGLTPEGIEQNDVAYEYMMETLWYDSEPDMTQWFTNYTIRRYGLYDKLIDQAWQLLKSSVYTDPIGIHNHGNYAIVRRPRIGFYSTLWYDPKNVTAALRLMGQYLQTNPWIVYKSETFVYDMVDVSRQSLQLIFDYYCEHELFNSVTEKDLVNVKKVIDKMLHVMDLLEQVLQCSKHFLLYNWIQDARALGNDTKEMNYNEEQARNQVTIWGPKGNIIDYASKHWSGLVSHYYKPRWNLFFQEIVHSLENKTDFNQSKFNHLVFEQVEYPFTIHRGEHFVKEEQRQNLIPFVKEIMVEASKTIDLKESTNLSFYRNSHDSYN